MEKIIVVILIYITFVSIGFCQEIDLPIFKETPKRGIYRTFDEFLYNNPGIIDSFFVESKTRMSENWEGTQTFTPRFRVNNMKVKNVWGFSDGDQVYIFHQVEYFPLEIKINQIIFSGFGAIDNSDAVNAALVGGLIGSGIYAATTLANAKKQKIDYIIHPVSGKIYDKYFITDETAFIKGQPAKLILYRRGKNELDVPVNFKINENIINSMLPGSFLELSLNISREPNIICYGENFNECFNLMMPSEETKYVECSFTKKSKSPVMNEVKTVVGEFYSKQSKYLQEKNEK